MASIRVDHFIATELGAVNGSTTDGSLYIYSCISEFPFTKIAFWTSYFRQKKGTHCAHKTIFLSHFPPLYYFFYLPS